MKPASRSRPCDTCRLRKTRCVKDEAQSQCVLCAFHGQRCTFLRGPLPRQRRQQQAAAEPERRGRAAAGGDGGGGDGGDDGHRRSSKPAPRHLAAGPRGHEPELPRQGPCLPHSGLPRSCLPRRSSDDGGGCRDHDLDHDHDHDHDDDDADDDSHHDGSSSPPAILNDTLGLAPATHARLIGPTDYREPMLLDLHRPPPPPPPQLARRLDAQTVFMVRADAAEAQRVADVDAIEAAVRPLGPTLVDLYFRIVHPSFPILHRRVFVSKHRQSHRLFAPSLLAAVYLVALDWRLYDRVLAGHAAEAMPDALALERLAERAVAHDLRRPKLSTVEAGLLLLQRHPPVAGPLSGRAFAAQMVVVAHELGLHLDCSTWAIPAWEVGLRRRLAWALYVHDRWAALVHGRPFLLHDVDWDVRPCADDDFPELHAPHAHVDARTGWDIFVRHVGLARMLADVVAVFYSPAAVRVGGSLHRLGVAGALDLARPFLAALPDWSDALPDALRLDGKPRGKLCARGALHLAHASVEIALHRALVRTLAPHTPDALRAAVRGPARAKLRAATDLLTALEPEQTAAFWGRAAAHQAAHVASLAALLWATAETPDEMAWCAARVGELRWALRVRAQAAPFAREALRLIEHDVGGFGLVRDVPEPLFK